jgi:hypothetical protein
MAHADPLPNDVLDSVAAKIGSQIGGSLGALSLTAATLEMTESFSVWFLGADAVGDPTIDISQSARNTGQWHHQINAGGKPEAFARSQPLGPDAASWTIQEFFTSEIAKKIDDAIDWIDQNVTGDPLARLLVVPAYQVHAFWLKEGDASRVVVVDMPAGFSHLQYQKVYTSKEFLEALAKEQHVIGIIPP